MNYLKEIIAFEREMEIRHLPANAQLLWYKLMMLCNKTGWQSWFQVDNPRLMAHLKMTRASTLIEARQKLILAGRIHYHRGKKGAPSQYHLIPFESPQGEGQTVGQSVPQSVPQSEVQTVAISKQKHKDKQKKREGAPAKSSLPDAQSHGRYHHVHLTAPQLSDLKTAHPGNWQALIQNLDTYLETHPDKRYHNHLAVMEKWATEDLTHPTGRKALCPEIQRDLSIYDELDAIDAEYFRKIGADPPP